MHEPWEGKVALAEDRHIVYLFVQMTGVFAAYLVRIGKHFECRPLKAEKSLARPLDLFECVWDQWCGYHLRREAEI